LEEKCSYLGAFWDATLPFTEPDKDNRCYARSREFRVFRLFVRKRLGVHVGLMHQRARCYANFAACQHHRALRSKRLGRTSIPPRFADDVEITGNEGAT